MPRHLPIHRWQVVRSWYAQVAHVDDTFEAAHLGIAENHPQFCVGA